MTIVIQKSFIKKSFLRRIFFIKIALIFGLSTLLVYRIFFIYFQAKSGFIPLSPFRTFAPISLFLSPQRSLFHSLKETQVLQDIPTPPPRMTLRDFFMCLGSGIIFRINLSLIICFALSISIFSAIYIPIQKQACDKTIVRVPEFIPGNPCYCDRNIGSSFQIASQVINNTDFSSQLISYDPRISAFKMVDVNGTQFAFLADTVSRYIQNYWSIRFSGAIVSDQIDIFDINYDPLGIVQNKAGRCGISHPLFNEGAESREECAQLLRRFVPNFNPIIKISYVNNSVLRDFCQLSYCEIEQCSSAQFFNIILFTITIAGVMFSFFRLVRFLLIFFIHKLHPNSIKDVEMASSGT